MSFLNIKDRSLRERTIEDYLALKKRLKQRNLEDRVDYQDYRHDLDKEYEPIVASQDRMTEGITDQLVPIKDQLEQLATLLNRPTLIPARAGNKRSAAPQVQPANKKAFDQFGPLAEEFLKDYLDDEKRKMKIDPSFGIRYDNNAWKIGNKTVLLNPDHSLFVDGETYEGTPGFWSLVTEKAPHGYTDVDLARYKELLHETSVLHQDYDKFVRHPRANRCKKMDQHFGAYMPGV